MLPAAITQIYTDLEVKFSYSCKDTGKPFSRANCTSVQTNYFLNVSSVTWKRWCGAQIPTQNKLMLFLKLPLWADEEDQL